MAKRLKALSALDTRYDREVSLLLHKKDGRKITKPNELGLTPQFHKKVCNNGAKNYDNASQFLFYAPMI
jgi:hypothetical protein